MPRNNMAARDRFNDFLGYLNNPHTKATLETCIGKEGAELAACQAALMGGAPLYSRFDTNRQWPDFLTAAGQATQNCPEINGIVKQLDSLFKNMQAGENLQAGHQDKRTLAHILGLKKSMSPVIEYIRDHGFDAAKTWLKTEHGVSLMLCTRSYPKSAAKENPGKPHHLYRRGQKLTEEAGSGDDTILCTAEEGFTIIPYNESVILVSKSGDDYTLELVVIRGIAESTTATTESLIEWLTSVISQACASRTDVRPNHKGKMSQIGLNMGPRHARILSWAKSFKLKITHGQMEQEDGDLIGGMSLFWALLQSYMPSDIVASVQKVYDDGFPTMATRNIPEGEGFTIMLDGKAYKYTNASRAPPEGYATLNYEAPAHTDLSSEVKWSFGWTVDRIAASNKQFPEKGGNLVDLGLKVLVQNCSGTMTAFRPEALHGTTDRSGVTTHGLSLTFSRRVAAAFAELIEKGAEIAGATPIHHHV